MCAETIYRACYANNNTSGLKAGSWQSLPRGRRRRKPRSRCETAKRSALGPYRPLTQRPQQADDRSEPGHWEGDLMIGANNASAIATLVERVSRLTLVVPLPHGYSADNVTRAVTAAFGRQPAEMAKTLTWDQGSEMARWADIEHNCTSKCSSAKHDPRGNAPATNKPTDCYDAGSPKAPTSTSTPYNSR